MKYFLVLYDENFKNFKHFKNQLIFDILIFDSKISYFSQIFFE